MKQNIEAITYAVSLILKSAVVAAKYSGRVRKRSLKRLAAMTIDEKDKVHQLDTQVTILQNASRNT